MDCCVYWTIRASIGISSPEFARTGWQFIPPGLKAGAARFPCESPVVRANQYLVASCSVPVSCRNRNFFVTPLRRQGLEFMDCFTHGPCRISPANCLLCDFLRRFSLLPGVARTRRRRADAAQKRTREARDHHLQRNP